MKRSALPLVRGRRGPREEMAEPEALAGFGEASSAISGAVVGHHLRDVDAELADVGDYDFEDVGDTVAGLIGIDLGEADAGVVVDADMHEIPAGPGRALAAVPGDAVAGLLETREFLNVQVQQRAGALPLVGVDRRSRFEGITPVKPCPAQDSADGGGRHSHRPRDLNPRLPLEAHCRNTGDGVLGCGSGLPVRPRTVVGQSVGALSLIPGDPRAYGARTDARDDGNEAHGQFVVEHAGDEFGSTRGGGSGILVDVHSVLRDETNGCANH